MVSVVVSELLEGLVVELEDVIWSNPRRSSVFLEWELRESVSVSVFPVRLPPTDGEDIDDGVARDGLDSLEVVMTFTRILAEVFHARTTVGPQQYGLYSQLPGGEVRIKV
jgi:hypothetical protein